MNATDNDFLRPSPGEVAARCGLPLVMLGLVALTPWIGGYVLLVLAVGLWKGAGVWL